MVKAEGIHRVIGLMSGTSLDGIDAAYIETDGEAIVRPGPALTVAYDEEFRARLRSILGSRKRSAVVDAVERELTERHAAAVGRLRTDHGLNELDLIGFHGHTILHEPVQGRTWQIGDGGYLAKLTGVRVAADFRSADVAAGGEGAPLVPVYHQALTASLEKPLAFLNIGGVANVTWIGSGGELLAFDTGPGNAPLDDWSLEYLGLPADMDGALALRGTADLAWVDGFLTHPYFGRPPPKSLDRNDFKLWPRNMNGADGAATLTEAVAAAIAIARAHFPQPVRQWIVAGGGRHNPALMTALERRLGCAVVPAENLGLDGDALEAQAFAYLAVRTLRGLPISFPGTTGIKSPLTGGVLCEPNG